MTVVAINKTGEDQRLLLKTKGFNPKRACAYTFKEGEYKQAELGKAIIADDGVTISLSPYSVTALTLDQ